jgi:transcriptional regulator with XRE-family HTH domain
MITVPQIRAARALLGWTQQDLSAAAAVGVATIRRIEGAPDRISGHAATLAKLQAALEQAGIVFIEATGEHGAGVKLRR